MKDMLRAGAISQLVMSLNMSPSTKREKIGASGAKFVHNNEFGYFICEKDIIGEWYIREDDNWYCADFTKEDGEYCLRRIN